ncbi:hypothetical protein BIW11_00141, partial [Tropilaelaps mercedesae]
MSPANLPTPVFLPIKVVSSLLSSFGSTLLVSSVFLSQPPLKEATWVPASRVKGEDMILVMGGVHWLSKIHMDTALKLLSEQGLHGVKVVVKTLGAGFHQRVHGVHYLPKEGLRKVIFHNQQLITQSLQRGFGVVDTFRMTYARFKDFTEGKCACHFHK